MSAVNATIVKWVSWLQVLVLVCDAVEFGFMAVAMQAVAAMAAVVGMVATGVVAVVIVTAPL